MPELFCELFSEEIPARLQPRAAADFARLIEETLAPLAPQNIQTVFGPRRIALAAHVAATTPGATTTERGPRASAPEQALAGFLRKHNARKESLRQEGDFWVLEKTTQSLPAATLIATTLPALLRRFPWPKSMRWSGSSLFTWIRPLRRITCLLDGAIVPFTLATETDDGHGLVSSNQTEGHRSHAQNAATVTSFANWQTSLRERHVIASAAEREHLIRAGIETLAAAKNIQIVPNPGLIEEVAGLVEWPVPLLGRIDDQFMDLPPEVMQVSMRVNQRYFATRTADGRAAPWFAFIANIEAPDGGAAIIAGNERVLRARFSDARHFWDLDRKTRLIDRVTALESVVFQAGLGTQAARAQRIASLAHFIALQTGAATEQAARAGLLCKADLTTGMVGEFPELQGIMGGYYAAHDGEDPRVCTAISQHYAPKGANDRVPDEPVAIAVALADKLDQLAGFFAIGQKPTGSGDPFALRRAALGVLRIIRENGGRLHLRPILLHATQTFETDQGALTTEILAFIAERLRVQLRAEGARHDILAAIFAAGTDDDFTRALAKTEALAAFLTTNDGTNLLAAYKRAANILRIEDRKDGPHTGAINPALLVAPEEKSLAGALAAAAEADGLLAAERFGDAMEKLACLRAPLDIFFEQVTVNADDPDIRLNRLRMLASLRDILHLVADFSQIEG